MPNPSSLQVTTYPKQRSSIGGDNFLLRIVPEWLAPVWWKAELWRNFVKNQPLAVIARETLIAGLLALDWKIVARESEQQESLKDEIKYYSKLLDKFDAYWSDMDFSTHVEWIAKDLLDLPFGGASELGREGDRPEGKVLWIRPLDGGTLAPTLDRDWPIIQRSPNDFNLEPSLFPYWAVSRTYMSPRTEIKREGWGMAPPEKIVLAMELMYRGDQYYANLLLDTPTAGILDLGDMEEPAAKAWIQSFEALLGGVNAFKIPVLYEHTTDTKWIPFGNLPNDLMFDNITMRYASMIAAGYGMSISDLGFPTSGNGGETLAGSIRQERRTRRTGRATLQIKMAAYFDQILPETLKFVWIDYDDELQVSQGRARLSNFQAWQLAITSRILTPGEARLQSIQDGLLTIVVPEDITKAADYKELPTNTVSNGDNPPQDKAVPPSQGGQGDVRTQQIVQRSDEFYEDRITDMAGLTEQALAIMSSPRQPDNYNISVTMPELAFPEIPGTVVNFPELRQEIIVSPTPVTIENNVDVSPTPLEVNIAPAEVNVDNQINVPETTVNVTNEVSPTPVEITNEVQTPEVNVTLKQAEKVISKVKRDINGRIEEVETETEE